MKKKLLKRTGWLILFLFLLMNTVAFFHAYQFTHFTGTPVERSSGSKKLSVSGKLRVLFMGISNPKPTGTRIPLQEYETVTLQSNKLIECWHIKTPGAKGTVIIFHGYGGEKSSMLDKSDEFLKLGYSTLLVDFMGSGGSEGNQTTIGYKEAVEVKTCYDYLQEKGETSIYLYGTSMGAVAIIKAIHDYNITPNGIILECPFGSLYQTTAARFRLLGVPAFPMAALLVFWGGVQNGYWAFEHNPTRYARSVTCPTLLLYGEKDKKVSRQEINAIYDNLAGKKRLITYPEAGHENYLAEYRNTWPKDISAFLYTQ